MLPIFNPEDYEAEAILRAGERKEELDPTTLKSTAVTVVVVLAIGVAFAIAVAYLLNQPSV